MLENIDNGETYLREKIKRTAEKFNLSDNDMARILFRKGAAYYSPNISFQCLEAMEYLETKIDSGKKRFSLNRDDVVDILLGQGTNYYFKDIATRYLHDKPEDKEV